MTNTFPALDIRPEQVQQPDVLGQMGKIMALRQQLQMQPLQLQTAQLQLQQEQMNVQSQNALMQAYTQAGGDPDQTLRLASQTGKVLPKDMLAFQQSQIAYKTSLANLTEKQLSTMQSQNGELRDAIDPIFQLPQEQQLPAANRLLAQLQNMNPQQRQLQYGLTDQQLAQLPPGSIQSIDQLKFFEATLAGHEKATDEQLKQMQTAKAAAETEKTTAEIPGAAAEAQMKQAAQTAYASWQQLPQNAGKTFDQYQAEVAAQKAGAESKARLPYEMALASYNRQSAMGNVLAEHALNGITSAFTDPQHGFSQTLAQLSAVKDNVAAAQTGDQLAASLAPLMTALGVTSFAGTHRINQNEINAAGSGVGSVLRQIDARLSKWGSGKLAAGTATEMNQLMDSLLTAKYNTVVQSAKVAAANGGVDPSRVTVMDKGGNLIRLSDATTGGGVGGAAPGFTRIKASDGNLHDIPTQNLQKARQIDPNLQVVQ